MGIDKIELTSDNGRVHAVIENPEGFKELGIDALEEAKNLLDNEVQRDRKMRIEELKNINEDLVYLGDTPEQYADAIVGTTCDGNHVVYDYDKFAECLVKEGMTHEEAYDWIGYNTLRSLPYAGEYAPIMINSVEG